MTTTSKSPEVIDAVSSVSADESSMVTVESERVMNSTDVFRFVCLSLVSLLAIGDFLFGWFVVVWVQVHPVIFAIASLLLLYYLLNQQGRWYLLLSMRRPRFVAAPPGLRVAVVTTYVQGPESLQLIEHVLRGLVAIRYPHDTWLLDEANDPAAREVCGRLGVLHFSRKGNPRYEANDGTFKRGTKHGNYNAWLQEIGYNAYDVLSAFDPDHVPHPEYLHQVLGYIRDPMIGYVQPAQAYYNQGASFVARGAAEETYAYYSSVQMASFAMGYPIIVGGHNVHRLSALRAVDGFAAHDADDLLLTLRYRNAGWRGVYLPTVLARGLTPVDWQGYLRQQRRWARSVIDIKLHEWRDGSRRLGWKSQLMSAMQGINFVHRGVVGLMLYAALLGLLLNGGRLSIPTALIITPLLLFIGCIATLEIFRQRFYLDPEAERGVHWRSWLLWHAKWPWFLAALVDMVSGRRHEYVVTPKTGLRGRYRSFLFIHGFLALGVLLAWTVGRLLGREQTPLILSFACLFVLSSVALLWTELRGFPAPFDIRQWRPITDPVTPDP